jgi:hypothetical protein
MAVLPRASRQPAWRPRPGASTAARQDSRRWRMPLMPGDRHRRESTGQDGKALSRHYVTLDQAARGW